MSDSLWTRSRRLWTRNVQEDVNEEVDFHFQMRVEQFMADGMSRSDAERLARERFGDVVAVRSTLVGIGTRRRRRRNWRDSIDSWQQDIAVSLRALRREPLFTVGVIATLGLGIGANATMFGVIDGLMLRGPDGIVDGKHVERLYITTNAGGAIGVTTGSMVGYVSYAALRDRAKSFDGIAAYASAGSTRYGTGAQTRTIPALRATWDLFPTLGVKPVVGRFYDQTDDHLPHGENVVVIGYDFWQSEFGGENGVVGRRITFGITPYTIVGVAPKGFTGAERVPADVWFPMSLLSFPNWSTTYNANWLNVVTRLKPGVSPEAAGAEATAILRGAYTGNKPFMRQLTASVRPLWFDDHGTPSAVANVSRWLMGVAVVVLLITCLNVVNLLVARTRRRRREIAVRIALGVGRARLLRLLLVETMLVTLGGAVAALVVASGGGRLMRATLLASLAWSGPAIDARLLGFTVLIAFGVGSIVGLAPAIDATRVELIGSLKSGARDGSGRRSVGRTVLTMAQAALCVVLLVGAGLFVGSLQRVRSLDLGFQPARVLRADPRFRSSVLDAATLLAQAQTYGDALARLQSLPWVEHAAIAVGSPYGNGFIVRLDIPGRDSLPSSVDGPFVSAVSADYFVTMGTPLRRGRVFTAADREGSTSVAIVGETMARTVWPGEDPIGKCLLLGGPSRDGTQPPCATIVGVVADVHRQSVREKPTMQYYVPVGQERGMFFGSVLVVRPRGPMTEAISLLRSAMAGMPQFSYTNIETIQHSIDPEFRPWQLGAAMFGIFGVLALIVASVGLYSVIAYLVADRTRELGVRLALGATSTRIVRNVVGRGMATTAGGVIVGTLIALAAGPFIQPLLFDISPRSPGVFAAVAVVVIAIAALASWSPARRASRVDPVIALRAD